MRGIFVVRLREYPIAEQTKVLETFFESWVRVNCAYLRAHPNVPRLYDSGVVYRREDEPRILDGKAMQLELWKDIPAILSDGYDDCEGLSAWLAAEKRCRDGVEGAVVKLVRQPQGVMRRRLWHAVVKDLDGGQVWDPSKRLGMRPRRRGRAASRRTAWPVKRNRSCASCSRG